MDCSEKLLKFCYNQKSITAAIESFVNQFEECYLDEDKPEQKIMAQCVQQMFRKFYYSSLLPDQIITPAAIVNTLCEREFGNGVMAVPAIEMALKNKSAQRTRYGLAYFSIDRHPFIADLESFLEKAAAGIEMDIPGIPHPKEHTKLKEGLWLSDRHYINILSLIALEAGYVSCEEKESGVIGRTTLKATDFMGWDHSKKLRCVINSAIDLCSKNLRQVLPEVGKEMTSKRIAGWLREPKDFEDVLLSIYKRMGLNTNKFNCLLEVDDFEDILQATGLSIESLSKLHWFQTVLDMYFFTPFGYYLQLIQPVYSEIYDLQLELAELLFDIDDFQEIRTKLFGAATSYDLTVLGEDLLGEGIKPERMHAIPGELGDAEMYEAVLAYREYLDNEEMIVCDDDDDDADFNQLMEGLFGSQPGGKREKAKIIDFPAKKVVDSEYHDENQVFVFKVKLFYAKRIWRQIEIKGTQSLHELHEVIFDAFDLEPGHLYAFFMSNKFWDPKTEYAHPEAESRSADRVKINQLDLNVKQKFAYIYDFGDENRFEVEVIATHDPEKKVKYPREVKRNKPVRTVCDECQSAKNPIEWYCQDHEVYLCDDCAQDEKHEECFITKAII